MKIAIGSDHRGTEQRALVANVLQRLQYEVVDCGTHTTDSCDYPDIARDVCESILAGKADQGVLLCGTGIGMSMAANKFPTIRAAVCHDAKTGELARQHNNANVLCMPSALSAEEYDAIVSAWLTSEFEGGRHQRRIDKISELDCSH